MRRRVLFTHFFNEAYLLPFWIAHHLPLFDHAVLIDYQSTDESVEICRTLAPHWEVRTSRNKQFEAVQCDAEVMGIEKEFTDCWKLAINTTEFFCVRDSDAWFCGIEAHDWPAYALRGLVLSEPSAADYEPLDPTLPLLAQRWHGFFEDQTLIPGCDFLSRSRLLHRLPHGAYHTGRHWTDHTPYMHPPGAILVYLLFSPWTPEFVARKLQIASRIPASEIAQGHGIQHLRSRVELEADRAALDTAVRDLRTDSTYWSMLDASDETKGRLSSPPNFAPLLGAHYDTPINETDLAVKLLRSGVLYGHYFSFKLAEDLCLNMLDKSRNEAGWLLLWIVGRLCRSVIDRSPKAANWLLEVALRRSGLFSLRYQNLLLVNRLLIWAVGRRRNLLLKK